MTPEEAKNILGSISGKQFEAAEQVLEKTWIEVFEPFSEAHQLGIIVNMLKMRLYAYPYPEEAVQQIIETLKAESFKLTPEDFEELWKPNSKLIQEKDLKRIV